MAWLTPVRPRWPRDLYGRAERLASKIDRLANIARVKEARWEAHRREHIFTGSSDFDHFYSVGSETERRFDQTVRAQFYNLVTELVEAGVPVREDIRKLRATDSSQLDRTAAELRHLGWLWYGQREQKRLGGKDDVAK